MERARGSQISSYRSPQRKLKANKFIFDECDDKFHYLLRFDDTIHVGNYIPIYTRHTMRFCGGIACCELNECDGVTLPRPKSLSMALTTSNISFDFGFEPMMWWEAPNKNPTMKCVTDVFWHANMLDAAETNKCVIEVDMIFIKIHLWPVLEVLVVVLLLLPLLLMVELWHARGYPNTNSTKRYTQKYIHKSA